MYVRFVRLDPRGDHSREWGVFHAVSDLRDEGALADYQADLVGEACEWLNEHLPVPYTFGGKRNTAGICWFKPDAYEPIHWVRQFVWVLEECGVVTDMLTTRAPGCIVYEDRYQIVAEPRMRTFLPSTN